jgi:MFS family permease
MEASSNVVVMAHRDRAAQTYRWELVRGGSSGVLEACWQAFALLVAIRYFGAGDGVKPFIVAGTGVGLTLSFFTLPSILRLRLAVAAALALIWGAAGAALLGSALAPGFAIFFAGVFAAQVFTAQGPQLIAHVYATNFTATERGARLSMALVVSAVVGIVFSYAGGTLLDADLAHYRWVFGAAGIAALVGAFAFWRIPSEPLASITRSRLMENLSLAWRDRTFGWLLVGWMLIGLGNLMIIPLRVEYLANPAYGLDLANAEATALLVGVVAAFRIVSTRIWGAIFDRLDLITVRVCLNLFFFASILIFFNSTSLIGLFAGSALLGVAFGGGGIMWALFVTKIAPPQKVPAYMSLHGFLTGIRMAAAPFIGYGLLALGGPVFAAWCAALLIALSTILFIPLRSRLKNPEDLR